MQCPSCGLDRDRIIETDIGRLIKGDPAPSQGLTFLCLVGVVGWVILAVLVLGRVF